MLLAPELLLGWPVVDRLHLLLHVGGECVDLDFGGLLGLLGRLAPLPTGIFPELRLPLMVTLSSEVIFKVRHGGVLEARENRLPRHFLSFFLFVGLRGSRLLRRHFV